jgi:hypothetical protein
MPENPFWTDIADTDFAASQVIENKGRLEPKKAPPNPSRYVWQKVNEVTWKLTNGEMTNVPASHGQWGGYRTTKALAWVIDAGDESPAWIARHKDQTTNPLHLKQAKTAAMAMAKGGKGDYTITGYWKTVKPKPPAKPYQQLVCGPVAHLNGLAARLLDREAA